MVCIEICSLYTELHTKILIYLPWAESGENNFFKYKMLFIDELNFSNVFKFIAHIHTYSKEFEYLIDYGR